MASFRRLREYRWPRKKDITIRPMTPITTPTPIPALAPLDSEGEEDADEADDPEAVATAAKADEEVEDVTLAVSIAPFVVLAPEELTISLDTVVDVPSGTLVVAGSLMGVVGAAELGIVAGVEAGVAYMGVSEGMHRSQCFHGISQ